MRFSWGLKYFDWMLVVGAVIVGFAIWFVPSMKSNPELQAWFKSQRELKAERLATEAELARIRKEADDLGIVYIPAPQPAEPKPEQK